MKRRFSFFLFLVLLVLSCTEEKRGDVFVRVYLNGSMPIEKADVYTKPSSVQEVTDQFGSVLLKGLKVGSYEVFASVSNVGSGKAVVNIKEDELVEVAIFIVGGINVGLAPTLNVVLPAQPADFSEGETVNFSANVSDDKTPVQKIAMKWESDRDGVINQSPPDANGNIAFSTTRLSKGVHNITVTATDEDGYKATATLQVSTNAPKPVVLEKPVRENGKVQLQWSKYTGSDFQSYEVYRSNNNCSDQAKVLLATIDDINKLNFTDPLPPLTTGACYYVRVTNTAARSRNSNQEVVAYPGGFLLSFSPTDALIHPTQPYLYLINKETGRLTKFDYEQMMVIKEISLPGTVGFCDIGDSGFGVEVLVPSSDGWIYIYDADNLSQKASINTGLVTASVVINGLGHVIASVGPNPWWEQPVRTYNRANGIHIDGNGGFERDRIRMIPGKNEAISISTSVSPIDMEYFKFDAEGKIEIHQDDTYHGDYPLDPFIFRISPNGAYIITSSSGATYTANSAMEYKGQLQRGSLSYSDFAFNEDGSTIYAATSNRKSIQIGSYPALTRSNEVLTKGYPQFIFRAGNRIIAVSKASEYSTETGIEIVELP